jgi:hypothetical protein
MPSRLKAGLRTYRQDTRVLGSYRRATAAAGGWLWARNSWKTTSRVPETHDFDPLFFGPQSINNAIRTANDFTQIGKLKFRHNTTHFREGRNALSPCD